MSRQTGVGMSTYREAGILPDIGSGRRFESCPYTFGVHLSRLLSTISRFPLVFFDFLHSPTLGLADT